MKFDEIRTTVLLHEIDIFACTESWLSDKVENSAVSISGYNCFRNDRSSRRGGGVAVWIKDHFPMCCETLPPDNGIECLLLLLTSCKVALFVAYVPPIPALRDYHLINDFIIQNVDLVLKKVPSYDLIVCGDFNRFNVNDICLSLNLVNVHNKPTYGCAELDYILISEDLIENYMVTTCSPFDRSKVPHLSLLAIPKNKAQKSN